MTIRFEQLLQQWYPQKDALGWVLTTITDTDRSTYRKAGAMMLINSLGQYLGMLSGGCLEGDLLAKAHKVLVTGNNAMVVYDLSDDGEFTWQQGLGCGGSVTILLQSVTQENDYLGLHNIHQHLSKRKSLRYEQRIDNSGLRLPEWQIKAVTPALQGNFATKTAQTSYSEERGKWLQTQILPSPRLLIFGGGLDAQPLAKLADVIGWHVSIVDQRHSGIHVDGFPDARFIKSNPSELSDEFDDFDAIIIMNHNITLDTQSLLFAHGSSAKYIGLLGPRHRREKIERLAGLTPDDFTHHYCGPTGLDIGASLPETIALAILAECHQVIEGKRPHHAPLNENCEECP